MSVSNALQEIKSTHSLIQHKHGKNVSLQCVAGNQIHAQTDPAQARQECQSPIRSKKSNTRTSSSNTSTATMPVSNAIQEIKSTYILIQHKHGKNVSLQCDARNQIHAHPDPAQARQECQSPMRCRKSNPRTP